MLNQSIDITAYGIPMSVIYDYEPGELPVFSGPHAGPGCAPSVYLLSVKVGGVDIYEMLSTEQMQRIEETILLLLS